MDVTAMKRRRLTALPALLAALTAACGPASAPVRSAGSEVPAAEAAPPAAESPAPSSCSRGVVRDDGSVETGYGFVPSATFGEYVQELSAGELPSREVRKVCVCFLKSRGERDADFEVVFYQAAGGRPAEEPYATVAGSAADLPQKVAEAGRFYEVDVSEVTVPEGVSYVGARWDPSAARFLFICTDQSEGNAPTRVFFREDRAPGWTSVADAKDPIFRGHRAVLVRVEAAPAP
jgi:hypothetical protein